MKQNIDSFHEISVSLSSSASGTQRPSKLDDLNRIVNSRIAPKEFDIPQSQQTFARPFQRKFDEGAFLGVPSSEIKSIKIEQYRRTRQMALPIFEQDDALLQPNQAACDRTKLAAKTFFSLANKLNHQTQKPFPLAGHNKCLGMVAIPNSKLVMIAVSQDKTPSRDIALRKELVAFLEEINEACQQFIFELAVLPTYSQYLMPRTLSRDTHRPATKQDVEPYTRCVEVALMVALNKIGRYRKITPQNAAVLAFGGTLWRDNNKDSDAVPFFEGIERNRKHVKQDPIEIMLEEDQSGWVDIWEPCACHCKIYKKQMIAIGAAGGPATSFTEQRADRLLFFKEHHVKSESTVQEPLDCNTVPCPEDRSLGSR